jgi:hypothetical protein
LGLSQHSWAAVQASEAIPKGRTGRQFTVGGYPEGRVAGFEGQVLTGRSRYWRASRVLACLSGVVNPLLEFEFEEKDKKTKKHREIKGLKQKNKI